MMAGNGMGDIEHRAPERIVQDRRCASCRNYQGRVCQHVLPEDREPVEYVRADLHRGAVEAVDALLVALDALNIEAEEIDMAEYDEAREAVERWLTASRGR